MPCHGYVVFEPPQAAVSLLASPAPSPASGTLDNSVPAAYSPGKMLQTTATTAGVDAGARVVHLPYPDISARWMDAIEAASASPRPSSTRATSAHAKSEKKQTLPERGIAFHHGRFISKLRQAVLTRKK